MNKRNSTIDILKFFFAIIVMLIHSDNDFFAMRTGYSIVPGGTVAVEFFFITSGFLLVKKAINEKSDNVFDANVKMISNKLFNFFPFVLFAALVSVATYYSIELHKASGGWGKGGILSVFNIAEYIERVLTTIPEILGFQMAGLSGAYVIGTTWFLSSLLIVSFAVYPFLCKYHKCMIKYVSPLIAIMLYGYISQKQGISHIGTWNSYAFIGLLRGFASILVGVASYGFYQYFMEHNIKPYILSLIELSGYAITIYFMFKNHFGDNYVYLISFILSISIAITFSEKSITKRISSSGSKISFFLGELSFSMYLSHEYIARNIAYVFPNAGAKELLVIYFVLSAVLSLINYYIGKGMLKVINKIRRKLILFV